LHFKSAICFSLCEKLAMQILPASFSLGHSVVAITRRLLHDRIFVAAHRMNETCFTRQRLLTFARLCVLIVQKTVRSAHAHLADFFAQLTDGAERHAGASAWTQARAKLKHTAFIELNEKAIIATVYAPANAGALRRWRDFRLVAIDSSLVRVPSHAALAERFGWVQCRNQSGPTLPCVEARLSVLYDVLNQIGLHTLVGPPARGERPVALEHLERLEAGDLAVLDRAYASYELFARFLQAGRHFVCRLGRNTFGAAQELFARGKEPRSLIVVLIKPRRGGPPGLPAQITVRLVSVALPNGEMEVLATSLLEEALYPNAELGEVYHQRWGIETYYGRLKSRLDLEHFSGHTLEAILQDIHATVYLSNLETVLIGPAQEALLERGRPAPAAPHVNHAVAFHAIKTRLIPLLLSDQDIDQTLAQMKDCFLRNAQARRPNRNVPRKSSPWRGYQFQRNVRKAVY
jgi:hypothetical protein